MLRSLIYDSLILRLTSRWYAEVLARVPDSAHLLDVGIGTAGALLANARTVAEKDLHITGIDIDADYIERARTQLQRSGLARKCRVHQQSVYDHSGGPYDVVYFSASFMLLPQPERALRHCTELLKDDGRILFTQTIQRRRSALMETVKPLLRRATSIDFGRVTYEDDFRAQLRAADLELSEFTVLSRHGTRDSVLAVAKPPTRKP